MLPVAVGAVGMWESGVWFLAGFPSAEGSVGNSSWLLEFSTLPSARHFHSAWPAVFSRIGTRQPAIARPPRGWSGHGWRVGDGLGRRAGLEIGRASCRERGQISVVAVSLKKKPARGLGRRLPGRLARATPAMERIPVATRLAR